MTPEYIFTILYIVFCICVLYPPIEFITSGLTIASVFSSFLGSEDEEFIRYHLKRSTLTLFIYSVLPLGYMLGLMCLVFEEEVGTY